MFIGLASITTSCKKDPVSVFTASKTTVQVGEPVVFTDGGDAKVKNTTYSYDFGDGSAIVTGVKNPSHVFTKPGTYIVSEFLSQNSNLAKGRVKYGSSTVTITVTSAQADFTASTTTPQANEVVKFTSTSTGVDGLGSPVGYSWLVTGNGSTNYLYGEETVTWKPTTVGVYTISLTVYQGNEYTSSKTVKEMEITVGGSTISPNEFQGILSGDWTTVQFTGNHTGAGYGVSGCVTTPLTTSTYATLGFDSSGGSTIGTLMGSTNVNSYSTIDITFASTGYVYVSGSIGSTNAMSATAGLYKIIGTPTNNSIVLSRTINGICAGTKAYTDVYTITLAR